MRALEVPRRSVSAVPLHAIKAFSVLHLCMHHVGHVKVDSVTGSIPHKHLYVFPSLLCIHLTPRTVAGLSGTAAGGIMKWPGCYRAGVL